MPIFDSDGSDFHFSYLKSLTSSSNLLILNSLKLSYPRDCQKSSKKIQALRKYTIAIQKI